MRVTREAPAAATGGLVEELKAQGQEEGKHELNKRLAITQQLKVGGFILEIDSNGAVFACSFGCLSHVSLPGYGGRDSWTDTMGVTA